jgi:hypothetical protein
VEWIIAVAMMFGCGYWASDIARRKGRSPNVFFSVVLLLPVAGVIVSALIPAGPPASAPVMVVVICPRCTARQDVDQHESTFRCWECATLSPVRGFTA